MLKHYIRIVNTFRCFSPLLRRKQLLEVTVSALLKTPRGILLIPALSICRRSFVLHIQPFPPSCDRVKRVRSDRIKRAQISNLAIESAGESVIGSALLPPCFHARISFPVAKHTDMIGFSLLLPLTSSSHGMEGFRTDTFSFFSSITLISHS